MKQKHILKWLGISLGVYLLYGVLTAILVPLPQKEATGELWSQYEARLSTDASQERVRSIEDTDSALLWRLQLIESAEREVIFSTFDLRADGSGQDLMAALYGAALCAVHGKELAAVDWEVETAAVTHVSLLSGSPRAEAKAPELWDALVRLMAQGDDVLLQTPYIICNDKMYNDLEALAETRQLRVLTNAVENGANPSGCSDYLREKQNILSRGVDVYEVVCGQSLHTKTILIGNDLSVVGSFNADMRSAYLDTELMLVIESEEVNAALRQESVQYIDQSRLALHDGGTEHGARFEEVTLPWTKRALYTILSVVQRPIRHLL